MTLDLSPFDRTEGMSIMPTENVTVRRAVAIAITKADNAQIPDNYAPELGADHEADLISDWSAYLADKAIEAYRSTAPATPVVGEDARAWGSPLHIALGALVSAASTVLQSHQNSRPVNFRPLLDARHDAAALLAKMTTEKNAAHPSTPTQREQALERALNDVLASRGRPAREEYLNDRSFDEACRAHKQAQDALSPAPSAPDSAAGEDVQLTKGGAQWCTNLTTTIEKAVGGAYEFPDSRQFWIDGPVAREITRRVCAAIATPPRLTIDEERVTSVFISELCRQVKGELGNTGIDGAVDLTWGDDNLICLDEAAFGKALRKVFAPALEGN